ncbi:hypothetical protein KAU04_05855 [bacterium]|nr:hypothetical protein [bacterium]
MAQSVKIAMSLPNELLQEVDMISKKSNCSRSATFRKALQMLVEKHQNAETLEKAKKIYHQTSVFDRNLSEKFSRLSSETMPTCQSQGDTR